MCSKIIYLVGLYLVISSLEGITKARHRPKPKPKPKGDKCDSPCPLPTSCEEIQTKWPGSISGYYHIVNKNGPTYVYCHMGELCGTEGGWTRLAYLNMSDSTESCPTGFNLYQSSGVRACGRATSNVGSCQSVQFPSNGVSYSQVCGRVVGYQFGSPDAVFPGTGGSPAPEHDDINSYYVDGVSITRGSARQHIWTLIAGFSESSTAFGGDTLKCPCSQGSSQNSQMFIGSDYFCESGNPNVFPPSQIFAEDPLWDGNGCSPDEVNCCSVSGLPWFNKVLNATTCDYIELRVCGDQSTSDEDVPVSFYEIYIK